MAKNAKELAENISDFVNVMSRDNSEFINAMAMEHPTLQQAFTRLCIQWLEHMASLRDHEIDARNKASRDMARALIESLDVQGIYGDTPSKYLPTI